MQLAYSMIVIPQSLHVLNSKQEEKSKTIFDYQKIKNNYNQESGEEVYIAKLVNGEAV